jgi:hypothetical protein
MRSIWGRRYGVSSQLAESSGTTRLDDIGWAAVRPTLVVRVGLNLNDTSISTMSRPPYGIFAAIRSHASTRPNDVALITPRSEALSYSRLARAIEAAAITLRNAGLGATARIGIAPAIQP